MKTKPAIRWHLLLLLALGIVSTVLSSCMIKAKLALPTVYQLPSNFGMQGDSLSVSSVSDSLHIINKRKSLDTGTVNLVKPKDFFTDKFLVSLIDSALANNQDLKIALNRIAMARAAYFIQRGPLLPSVSTGVSTTLDRYGENTMNGVGNYDTNLSPNISGDRAIPNPSTETFAGLRASWELDFWGKLRNRRLAAQQRLLATELGRNWLKTQIVAEVARLFFTIETLETEADILRRNIKLQETALELVKAQKAGGRSTELTVQQATALLARSRSMQYNVAQRIIEAEARLNLLLGRYQQPVPRAQSLNKQPLPKSLKTGIPGNTLLYRPDVQSSYHELQASIADADAATAAFYPSFTITPYIGLSAFTPQLLAKIPAAATAGVAAGLNLPIFNRWALKGERNAAYALAEERLHVYQKSLLQAYAEASVAMSKIQNANQENLMRQREVAAMQQAVTAANSLYMAGYANYLELLTVQRGVLEAELGQMETRRDLLEGLVDLYQSLGGGWR